MTLIGSAGQSSESEMDVGCTDIGTHVTGRRQTSLMKAGTVCLQLMEVSMFTAGEENERRLVAFRRSCHLVEGVPWGGEGSVGRRGQHRSSLTET